MGIFITLDGIRELERLGIDVEYKPRSKKEGDDFFINIMSSGYDYLNEESYTYAEYYFESALKIKKTHWLPWAAMAEVNMHRRPEEAERCATMAEEFYKQEFGESAEKIIELNDIYINALLNRKEYGKAYKKVQKAMKANPENEKYRKANLILSLELRKDFTKRELKKMTTDLVALTLNKSTILEKGIKKMLFLKLKFIKDNVGKPEIMKKTLVYSGPDSPLESLVNDYNLNKCLLRRRIEDLRLHYQIDAMLEKLNKTMTS